MDSCNASNSAAIIKILFVESNCDEKKSSYILEDATSELRKFHIYCTFTVVCNGFVALECFEHTKYDMLIVDRECTDGLEPLKLLSIIRSIGSSTPMIILIQKSSATSSGPDLLGTEAFSGVLLKPFNAESLLNCIIKTLNLMPGTVLPLDTIQDKKFDNEQEENAKQREL